MANRLKEWKLDCKVYIGDLGYGAAKQELEDVFSRYGPIRNVWVARNPPGFAFVEFQDPRDAEDATKALDGTYVIYISVFSFYIKHMLYVIDYTGMRPVLAEDHFSPEHCYVIFIHIISCVDKIM